MQNSNNTAITEEDKKMFSEDLKLLENRLNEIADDDFDKRSSITEKGGRPYKNSPKELAEGGIGYLKSNIENGRPITISGLSLVLNTSRRQLINLQRGRPDGKNNYDESFSNVVSTLKDFVGYYYEIMGERAKNPYFYIFALRKLWGIDRNNLRK